ncbi:C1QTNF4 [Branchiostoma lanceolatum]|uniref:C1QTNF4 protein n=1 Tax=Branchiostoma lanceolatum TaxID=7740 RepID=A0A8K0E5X2_BRALA|nr:C1QTNF4 [Branchiostoma lanceolatum]
MNILVILAAMKLVPDRMDDPPGRRMRTFLLLVALNVADSHIFAQPTTQQLGCPGCCGGGMMDNRYAANGYVQTNPVLRSAFSVARQSSLMGAIETSPVQFDKVFVNDGGDFDGSSGKFRCQIPGIYFFSFNIQTYDHKYVEISLMKSRQKQITLYAESDERNIMQSQSVMLTLIRGDKVWLQLKEGTHHAARSFHDNRITFSGYMVYANV